MDPFLLTDPRLAFIALLAGVVAMLTTLNVAARPAAVRTYPICRPPVDASISARPVQRSDHRLLSLVRGTAAVAYRRRRRAGSGMCTAQPACA